MAGIVDIIFAKNIGKSFSRHINLKCYIIMLRIFLLCEFVGFLILKFVLYKNG